MGKKKPKIFIGINEIADITLTLAQGLRELGYDVTNAVLKQDTPVMEYGRRHTRYIKRGANKYAHLLHRLVEFCRVAPFHDIFIFNFSESFLPSALLSTRSGIVRWLAYRDLPLLRAMGKKIAIISNGCDVMHYSAVAKQAAEDGFTYHICLDCDSRQDCSLDLQRKKVELIERYADYLFTNPLVGVLFRRPFFTISVPIDLSTISYAFTPTRNPLILHAPTNRSKKGTKYLIEAVERLRKEGHRFRLLLCENMTNVETRKKLTQSEIVVDQLLGRGHGLFTVEAMASGNAVLVHAIPGLYGYPPDLPIIPTKPDTIYENLKLVLDDPGLRQKRATVGRAFVEKHHDHVVVARRLLTQMGETP